MATYKLMAVLLATLAFVSGCSGNGHSAEGEVLRARCDEYNLEEGSQDIVLSVNYLVLDIPEGEFLGRIDKVLVSDEKIYVGDYKNQKIYVFDQDGKLQGVLNKRGRGPGEYLMMRSFSVANGVLYVLDDYEFTILSYDAESLLYRKSAKAPVFACDFSALLDGGFLFAYAPPSGNLVSDPNKRYRVVVTDADMHIRRRYFPYKEDEVDAISFGQYLSEAGEKLVYGTFREDGYCLFSRRDGHLEEHVAFEFSRPLPASDRSSLQAVATMEYNHMSKVPVCCGDYVVFDISSRDAAGTCVYNRGNGRFQGQRLGEINHMLVGIVGSERNCLVGNWGHKANYENLVRNGFDRAEKEEEEAILADMPFLVFYCLKD